MNYGSLHTNTTPISLNSFREMAENGIEGLVWSDEHDSVPLKLRLKILLANKRAAGFPYGAESVKLTQNQSISPLVVVKNEDQQCGLENNHFVKFSETSCMVEGNEKLSQEKNRDGLFGESSCIGTRKHEHMNLNDFQKNMKNEIKENEVAGTVKTGTEIADDFLDDLDQIVLKERRRLLLLRNVLELTKPVSKGKYSSLSNQAGSVKIRENLGTYKNENSSSHADSSNVEHPICDAAEKNCHNISNFSKFATSTGNTMVNGESNKTGLSNNDGPINKSGIGPDNLFGSVKAEPMEYDVLALDKGGVFPSFSNNNITVKSEFPEDYCRDKIDHMLLSDRIKMLASKETSNISRGFESSNKIMPSFRDTSPIASESIPSLKINRPRKRKKTVTDSIETALEEDAPGLLKVLIDKGVLVDEIKLYGVGENDEAPNDSLEENFSDLEAVMSKLFFQRQSFLKLGNIRCLKGEKPSYCLACLGSLVEQARYLQFRKWPVEWGWCRDLQSFIFVFERHHRIVLERPEYGYATYFFELVDSLRIDWQIKRLVTAMKLTSCGRITLIENRSLLVGEDLTEGEARVLMGYGWTPSSGLGTMLNYCDRVVHDRRNEKDSSEWKSKIAKLLMDGYSGGTFISPKIPEKIVNFSGAEDFQVKLEI